MVVQAAFALLLLLLVCVLGVRAVLRARCLGKCAACPHARTCAAMKKNTASLSTLQTDEAPHE